jgi:cyanophycinase
MIHFRPGCRVIALVLAASTWGVIARPGEAPAPSRAVESATKSKPAPPAGSLVIGGGGHLPDEVYRRFLDLAGGRTARLVLIPTAREPRSDGADPSSELKSWTDMGIASARMLHTRSRAEADAPAFAAALADATGVWIGGGVQTRLADVYAGTEVERQLRALLGRGGVIGGSSAGAAIMTRVMIAGGKVEPIEGRGFDLLPGAVVDQHFLKRNRIGRLTRLLEGHPDLVGFGIDEETALVVDLNGGRVDVVGVSSVVARVPASGDRPARSKILKPGDRVDLASLAVPIQAASLTPLDGPGRSR